MLQLALRPVSEPVAPMREYVALMREHVASVREHGYGAAERAIGIALGADDGEVAVSTKVGRIVDEA